MERVYPSGPDTNAAGLPSVRECIQLLKTHARWWAIPAVAFTAVAGLYAILAPQPWTATQALTIRPEVASVSDEKLGKFADLSEMKTLQETVLELARSQRVVQATLRDVGPPAGYRRPSVWPTALDVAEFRECVDMRPPGGSEFGKTEVFYLTVSDVSKDRARALIVALSNHLEERLQALRDERARGMISELEQTVKMADGDLGAEIDKLGAFETRVGADLAELRNLNADVGGQSEVSQVLQAIDGERRANDARHDESQRLRKVLVAALDDPRQLLATPNSLLISQPAVSQLKNALVSAQLRTADLLGSRSEEHPFVMAAREAESSIQAQLNAEIGAAIRGVDIELELCRDREKSLKAKYAAARERMAQLATSRAEYANLVSSVENHTRLAEAARKSLADARARQAAAHSASVMTRIDGVEAGTRPAGPSRKTVVACGGIGGLLFGFGLVFLFAGPVEPIASVTTGTRGLALNRAEPAGREIARPRAVSESFGMFRGLSLEEAVQAVKRRTT